MNKNKIFLFTALIIILIGFNASAANYGGILKVKTNQRPLNLNPIYAANDTEIMIKQQIFDKLLIYQNGEIVSNLAESWELNNNATIFRFDLKKDVSFQSYQINDKENNIEKRKVTAEDWKWSFEYLASPENKSPYAELFEKVKGYDDYRQGKKDQITGIKVVNQYRLEIELKEPYAPFIYNLLKEAAVVMPREAILNRKHKFSLAPVGTGAFKYKDFINNKIILEKNNGYWKNNYQEKKLPFLNQIEIYFPADKETNYKKYDFYQLNSEEIKEYQKQKDDYSNYYLEKIANNNYYYIALNSKNSLKEYSSSSSLKRKLYHILKENYFTADINNINNLISPPVVYNSQNFLDLIYNQDDRNFSSKNILSDNNLTLTMAVNNTEQSIEIAELIKKHLKSKNIDLNIKKYNWLEYLDFLKNNEKDLFIMSYHYENKFDFISDNFYSTSDKNYYNYKNRRLDNLVDYLKLEDNINSQELAYKIIEDILRNDNPFILLFKGADNYLVSNRLANPDILKNSDYKNSRFFELLYLK